MKFSEKLIELRKQKRLSQEELGFKINVSRQTISKWEAEQTSPEIEKVKELSKVFDVSIEYLLNDELENQKQVIKRFNKKKIGKIVLKVILIIISIYLIISLFKFGVLLKYSIKANKIADYDNYSIMTTSSIKDELKNNYSELFTNQVYGKGIQILEEFEDNIIYITYINSNEGKAYNVRYSEVTGEYYDYYNVQNDVLDFTSQTIRELTQDYIPNTLKEIIIASLNPSLTISHGEESVYGDSMLIIKQKHNGFCFSTCINKVTGIVDNVSVTSKDSIYITSFEYLFDNDTIPGSTDEPYIEGIDMLE